MNEQIEKILTQLRKIFRRKKTFFVTEQIPCSACSKVKLVIVRAGVVFLCGDCFLSEFGNKDDKEVADVYVKWIRVESERVKQLSEEVFGRKE